MTLPPLARNLLSTVVVLGLLLAAVGVTVFSAYTSVTSNDGNSFTAGSIQLTDNDGGSALFNVNGFTPGDSFRRCLRVNYTSTGGVQSEIRLFGTTTGTLGDFLDLEIRRGTVPAGTPFGDCTGFIPESADPLGHGPGVILQGGTLADFPDNAAGALVDPAGTWANGDSVVYEIRLDVQNDNAAMGLSVTQDFRFEARTL